MAGVQAALDTDSRLPSTAPLSFSYMLAQQTVPLKTLQHLTETAPIVHAPNFRQSDRWVVTPCIPTTCTDPSEPGGVRGVSSSTLELVDNIEPPSHEAPSSLQCSQTTQADNWHEHEPSRRQATTVTPDQASDTRCPTAAADSTHADTRHSGPPLAARNDFDDPEVDNFMNDESYITDHTTAPPDHAFDMPPCHLVTEDDLVNTCATPVVITITADFFPTPTTDHVPLLASNSTPRISATRVPPFVKSKAYSGSRAGMVFRIGLLGLGFYPDILPVIGEIATTKTGLPSLTALSLSLCTLVDHRTFWGGNSANPVASASGWIEQRCMESATRTSFDFIPGMSHHPDNIELPRRLSVPATAPRKVHRGGSHCRKGVLSCIAQQVEGRIASGSEIRQLLMQTERDIAAKAAATLAAVSAAFDGVAWLSHFRQEKANAPQHLSSPNIVSVNQPSCNTPAPTTADSFDTNTCVSSEVPYGPTGCLSLGHKGTKEYRPAHMHLHNSSGTLTLIPVCVAEHDGSITIDNVRLVNDSGGQSSFSSGGSRGPCNYHPSVGASVMAPASLRTPPCLGAALTIPSLTCPTFCNTTVCHDNDEMCINNSFDSSAVGHIDSLYYAPELVQHWIKGPSNYHLSGGASVMAPATPYALPCLGTAFTDSSHTLSPSITAGHDADMCTDEVLSSSAANHTDSDYSVGASVMAPAAQITIPCLGSTLTYGPLSAALSSHVTAAYSDIYANLDGIPLVDSHTHLSHCAAPQLHQHGIKGPNDHYLSGTASAMAQPDYYTHTLPYSPVGPPHDQHDLSRPPHLRCDTIVDLAAAAAATGLVTLRDHHDFGGDPLGSGDCGSSSRGYHDGSGLHTHSHFHNHSNRTFVPTGSSNHLQLPYSPGFVSSVDPPLTYPQPSMTVCRANSTCATSRGECGSSEELPAGLSLHGDSAGSGSCRHDPLPLRLSAPPCDYSGECKYPTGFRRSPVCDDDQWRLVPSGPACTASPARSCVWGLDQLPGSLPTQPRPNLETSALPPSGWLGSGPGCASDLGWLRPQLRLLGPATPDWPGDGSGIGRPNGSVVRTEEADRLLSNVPRPIGMSYEAEQLWLQDPQVPNDLASMSYGECGPWRTSECMRDLWRLNQPPRSSSPRPNHVPHYHATGTVFGSNRASGGGGDDSGGGASGKQQPPQSE